MPNERATFTPEQEREIVARLTIAAASLSGDFRVFCPQCERESLTVERSKVRTVVRCGFLDCTFRVAVNTRAS